uniref:Kelch like family member 32 n=1 Tax=Pelusios castaneus TaxID=367368 RepID=A0A8C8S7V4_9SAUR
MPSERCLSIQEMLTGQRLCQSSSHNDAVLAALNQQRSDGILCDVTLIAEEQKFHAHKAVLAACSDYFRAMFSLCMVESGADEVNLRGVTSLGLKQALDFAYTGQISGMYRLEFCLIHASSNLCNFKCEILATQINSGNIANLIDRSLGEHSLVFNFEKRISYHFIIPRGILGCIDLMYLLPKCG